MLCRNPFMKDGAAYRCGQCMPCRFQTRRMWTNRLMLEAGCHEDNTVVTLTYADEFLPRGATLVKEHVQLWLKRLRKEVAPARLRFYAVGEYGDRGDRPHYHVALFGFPNCCNGQTINPVRAGNCCKRCNLVFQSWGMGGVKLMPLEISSAQYICGYVTKKMTSSNDPMVAKALNGRSPEFSLKSNRPGIGALALDDVADRILKFNLVTGESDVPVTLAFGRRQFPLGRYMRQQLRKRIGRDEKALRSPQLEEEMRRLREIQFASPQVSLKETILKDARQKFLQFEARRKLKKERKKL